MCCLAFGVGEFVCCGLWVWLCLDLRGVIGLLCGVAGLLLVVFVFAFCFGCGVWLRLVIVVVCVMNLLCLWVWI